MDVYRFFIVLAMVGLVSLSAAFAQQPDSISINFGANTEGRTAQEGTNYGAVAIDGLYWNNYSEANATKTSVINNAGKVYSTALTWASSGLYQIDSASTAILRGYLDDGNVTGGNAPVSMSVPYFSYDVYAQTATDNGNKFYAMFVNGTQYTYSETVQAAVPGAASWGDCGSRSNLVEGENYLRITNQVTPSFTYSGGGAHAQVEGVRLRGTIAALQFVNTAASYSTWLDRNSTWGNLSWQDDLTGEADLAWENGKQVRIISTEDEINISLGGQTPRVGGILAAVAGSADDPGVVSIERGTVELTSMNLKTTANTLLQIDSAKLVANNAPAYLEAASAARVTITDFTAYYATTDGFLPGVYVGENFAKFDSAAGQVVAVPLTTERFVSGSDYLRPRGDAANFNMTEALTLNSLTTEADFVFLGGFNNDYTLTLTSGSLMMRTGNHWIKADGNPQNPAIVSGLLNNEGTYDLFVATMGTGFNDFRINGISVADNNGVSTNFFKTGNGALTLANATSTYTGRTSVLDGRLVIAANNNSSDYYVAEGAELQIQSRTNNSNDAAALNITAAGIAGGGEVVAGYGGRDVITLEGGGNFVHDGSTLRSLEVNAASFNIQGDTVLQVGTLSGTGAFNFLGGTLAADTVEFSLAQQGGVFSPGGVDRVWETVIDGDYSAATGSSILLDIISQTVFDKILAAGEITFDSDVILQLNDLSTDIEAGDRIYLADIFAGSSTDGWDNLLLDSNVTNWMLGNEGGAYYLESALQSQSAVPEPATWFMLLLGVAGLGVARRRKGCRRG